MDGIKVKKGRETRERRNFIRSETWQRLRALKISD